jgi:tripartite-type tricarboxylate transporter receptor subunit TctC
MSSRQTRSITPTAKTILTLPSIASWRHETCSLSDAREILVPYRGMQAGSWNGVTVPEATSQRSATKARRAARQQASSTQCGNAAAYLAGFPMSVADFAVSQMSLRVCLALLLMLALAFPEGQANAETKYPTKAVRIVLPFAAGGVADITARIIAEKLGGKLGGRFYVENQPGAGGIAAARTVISSPRDGHTLALLSNGTAVSVSLFNKLPYDPLRDFDPISSLGFFDFVFATNPDSEFKTLAEFIAAAKAKPAAFNVGTINVGSTQNLSAELFKTAAGVDFTIIPYRGTPELLVSTMQGNLALMIDSYSSMKGNLIDKKIRALASSGSVRSESTPDIPTLRESGVADYDVVSWNALFAPAGTPPDIVNTLNQALGEILAEADVKRQLLELGIQAKASTPDEISARLKSDIDKWRKVIEKAGIQKQ